MNLVRRLHVNAEKPVESPSTGAQGEWNLVNGVLLGALAFICFFELRVSAKAMQVFNTESVSIRRVYYAASAYL